MSQFLSTSIEFLKGVGPNRADILNRIGIFTFGHLLNYFPFRYVDKSNFSSIRSVDPNSKAVQIKEKNSKCANSRSKASNTFGGQICG